MRHSRFISSVALVATTLLSGCNEQKLAQNGNSNTSTRTSTIQTSTMPSGTAIDVTLATALTSKTASVGDAWSGSIINGRDGIPAGSLVSGTVTSVTPARKGDRAMLDLGLSAITVDGRSYRVGGSTEAIIAGSTRARNLGAIAGGAAAGALVGRAVSGGSNKGTVIGAVVGGGAATGVVASSDGYQVVLKPGIALTFTTNEAVAVRL